MEQLNYHHLRYFHAVARDGNLSRTAERLNVAQSSLSMQIKTLEERLGHPLFERVGRTLVLTEVGRIALDHADQIFGAGDELLATLKQSGATLAPLRVGALSTLSRNFQMSFLLPLLARDNANLVLKSGNMAALLADLRALALDVVLTTQIPQVDQGLDFAAQRLDEQAVGLHGLARFIHHDSLAELIAKEPLIVPTDNAIRTGFESLLARLGVTPHIIAEVDDMAMVRLLARQGAGIAVAPAIVLADEIADGLLQTAPFDLQIVEPFYAVTIKRKYPHPMLAELLQRRHP